MQPCSPKSCTETSHSPSQVDMSILSAQQLPHQAPVLPDAMLDINLLFLQGNKALSSPALEQPQLLLSGAVNRSSGQHSPLELKALGEAVGSITSAEKRNPTPNVCTGMGWWEAGAAAGASVGNTEPQAAPKILWVSTGQGHDLGRLCEGFSPALFSQQGREEWLLGSAKFATGQRPFPAPLTAGDLKQFARAESLEGQPQPQSLPLHCA